MKFVAWIKEHDPIRQISRQLVNLANGQVTDESIHSTEQQRLGGTVKSLFGVNFTDVRVDRKKKVVLLSKLIRATLKVGNKGLIMHSQQQSFHRISCLDKDKS